MVRACYTATLLQENQVKEPVASPRHHVLHGACNVHFEPTQLLATLLHRACSSTKIYPLR